MPHVCYLSRVSCVYIHPLADNRRKGRCIRRRDTSATTPAATAGATSVGRAHMTMMNFLDSLPDTPPLINTHADTQLYVASIGGRRNLNVTVCCLSSASYLLVGVCLSELLCRVCVCVCVQACMFWVNGANRVIRLVLENPPSPPPSPPRTHPNPHAHTHMHTNVHTQARTHATANTL